MYKVIKYVIISTTTCPPGFATVRSSRVVAKIYVFNIKTRSWSLAIVQRYHAKPRHCTVSFYRVYFIYTEEHSKNMMTILTLGRRTRYLSR